MARERPMAARKRLAIFFNMAIETIAAEIINNEPIEIKIGSDTYRTPRPTLRTMIAASKEISKLPKLDVSEKIVSSMLSYAGECGQIAAILAIIILGAKPNYSIVHKWRIQQLTRKIKNKYTIGQIYIAYSEIITRVMQIQSFFALTTSLNEINLLRRTKEVEETKTTQSGQ